MEDCTNIDQCKLSEIRGMSGPIKITNDKPIHYITRNFINSCKNVGYIEGDYNGEDQFKCGPTQYNIKNGVRCSTYIAYLQKQRKRKNLHILTDCHVVKVLIRNLEAKGVRYIHNNITKDIYCK